MTVDKLEVCLGMVTHGLGYAIISSYLPLPESLYRRPISLEGQQVKNRTWLLYRHNIESSPVMQSFIHILKSTPL